MPSRMDKYKENTINEFSGTRSEKNERLYKNIYTNRRYTEIGDIDSDNVIDISKTINQSRLSRSDFQRKRMLYEDGIISEKKSFNSEVAETKKEEELKNYDVNEILEEARKNRIIDQEEEKQRKIKNVEYSILFDLSQEKLKEYRDRKEKALSPDEEENLEGLIHTITSNSLKKKIDDGLLTDLMPETEEEAVISKDFLDSLEIDNGDDVVENENTKELTLETTIDKSFFTRSMDLKKEDILPSDEIEKIDEEVDNSFDSDGDFSTWKVVFTILSVVLVIGILLYVLLRFI